MPESPVPGASDAPNIKPGLVEALATAYAELIKRQRTASAAFVRWATSGRRTHEFAWIPTERESLMTTGSVLRIGPDSPVHGQFNTMMATIELNPYERELLYGYPYIIGHVEGITIRAPILTLPISIISDGGDLIIQATDEVLRFNSLPFRSDVDTSAREHALARLIDQTPAFPLQDAELKLFTESMARELGIDATCRLDGTLSPPPAMPQRPTPLKVVDNAACFLAPKTSYFLASDLRAIASAGADSARQTALGSLIGDAGASPTSDRFDDARGVFFPFPSNRSQRRVATLADDTQNRIIVVQGPPGTGKSRTIANVVCHLVAQGRRVLVSSQKDKAMDVVDEMLRELGLAELPMTLLRQDRESREELRDRLDSIEKQRPTSETQHDRERVGAAHNQLVNQAELDTISLARAIRVEQSVFRADQEVASASTWLRRLRARWRRRRALQRARHDSPEMTDVLGARTTSLRSQLLSQAVRFLHASGEHRTGEATRGERNQLREFSKLLGRNQTAFKNFSVFDRLKEDPARCNMLLKTLPCWIMSPDDVARLFPCEPGLFDTVIVDEASQCDLPSMTPVLYRAKQAIIAGDSKQMQAQRFAFTAGQVSAQAWRQHGLDKLDPDGWLDPAKIDLLQLAAIRSSEEVFLDEHFRSLPDIISFSNDRWYRGRMRLMRDRDDRRVGDPDAPTVRLQSVVDALVTVGTQENPREADALVAKLRSLANHPGYADATFGVVCLFEEQMRLVNDLIAKEIDDDTRQAHDLVVVNPDGFQGDERDVILYSLSYDGANMPQAALSARQADRPHIQGMLNVAFTRAREEIHVFHSAPVEAFGLASGKGTIVDWLRHCAAAECAPRDVSSRTLAHTDSEFEAEVIRALNAQGIRTLSQYPSCGFFIDIVAERDDRRIAIECDGEIWHYDEHGQLRIEDVQRQDILERAGWQVLRIPYRKWRLEPDEEIARVARAFVEPEDEATSIVEQPPPSDAQRAVESRSVTTSSIAVNAHEAAVLQSVRADLHERSAVLQGARERLGKARMGSQIRRSLEAAVSSLVAKKLLSVEDSELFATAAGRTVELTVYAPSSASGRRRRSYRYRRRW